VRKTHTAREGGSDALAAFQVMPPLGRSISSSSGGPQHHPTTGDLAAALLDVAPRLVFLFRGPVRERLDGESLVDRRPKREFCRSSSGTLVPLGKGQLMRREDGTERTGPSTVAGLDGSMGEQRPRRQGGSRGICRNRR